MATKDARDARDARDADDPDAWICGHDHRIHYLGGGIWVCFACWAKLLIGSRSKRAGQGDADV